MKCLNFCARLFTSSSLPFKNPNSPCTSDSAKTKYGTKRQNKGKLFINQEALKKDCLPLYVPAIQGVRACQNCDLGERIRRESAYFEK